MSMNDINKGANYALGGCLGLVGIVVLLFFLGFFGIILLSLFAQA